MASRTPGKRLLTHIVSLCDKVEYHTEVIYTGLKASAGTGEIHGFELVDELTPSKQSHGGKRTTFIINAKWSQPSLAYKEDSKFLVRSGAGWRDGEEYFRSLAKEQRPWWQEWTEELWAKKRQARWKATAVRILWPRRWIPALANRLFQKIEFLNLPAEIRNLIYSMVLPRRDIRPYKYTRDPPLRTRWTFFARPLRHSTSDLMRVNRKISQEYLYTLYRFCTFWFSDLDSLSRFFNGISTDNLALVRAVKLRLDAGDIFAAFEANFSADYLDSTRSHHLDQVMRSWKLERLIVEFPCGFQLQPPSVPFFGVCNLTWCKWIVKAVMEYCSTHTVAERVDFIGGPGFLPVEKRALAEVKARYQEMPYASMDPGNTGSLSYVCHSSQDKDLC